MKVLPISSVITTGFPSVPSRIPSGARFVSPGGVLMLVRATYVVLGVLFGKALVIKVGIGPGRTPPRFALPDINDINDLLPAIAWGRPMWKSFLPKIGRLAGSGCI